MDQLLEFKRAYIIAEAGVNHNGSMALAYQLIDAAKQAGADAVKFQTFKADTLVVVKSEMADYQKKNLGVDITQHRMLQALELTYENFKALKSYCDSKGIQFLSSAFDEESIDFLDDLQPYYKVPSGELTNYPYLKKTAEKGKPIILSTGMATMEEVRQALFWIRRVHDDLPVILLHCTTNYPTPFDEVNLNAMRTMEIEFKCPVGYSDHTLGAEVPVAAVALGAKVIEKHFTLDKTMEGPDHGASLEPSELKIMVDMIRNIEVAMGNGIKEPNQSELKIRERVRKSLVSNRHLDAGEILTENDIAIKRPGDGIAPHMLDDVLGKRLKVAIEKDVLFSWDMLI